MPADMLVTLGDNDYTESPRLASARTGGGLSAGPVGPGLRVAGVLGNHDYHVDRGRYELGLLGMPRPYYTRKLGDAVQLFLLDSNNVNDAADGLARKPSRGVERDLEDRGLPPSAVHVRWALRRPNVQRRWVPLFERYGVQLVLSGHDHNYERFVARNGVTYVVHGGGAAGLYPLRRCPAAYPVRARARVEHGFLYVAATRSGWTATRSTCAAGSPTGSASNRRARLRGMAEIGTMRVKSGLAEMLKGGVIMDVTDADQARIAEDAGACRRHGARARPGRHPRARAASRAWPTRTRSARSRRQ